MGGSLNPTRSTRLVRVLRPDWTRTVLVRRWVAGGLVVVAGIAAMRPGPQNDRLAVVVAARDLGPGAVLTVEDVRLEPRISATVPDGSQTSVAAVDGSILAGAARRGEVLTDVRLLGARLTESAAGPDGRVVPVWPADAGVVDLVRPGEVVDILAASDSDSMPRPKVVATDAVVVSVSPQPETAAGRERAVLVALPRGAANAVAAAALTGAVTFTLH